MSKVLIATETAASTLATHSGITPKDTKSVMDKPLPRLRSMSATATAATGTAATVSATSASAIASQQNGSNTSASALSDDAQMLRSVLVNNITTNDALNSMFREMQAAIKCAVSGELADRPRVLGNCGHITGDKCLEKIEQSTLIQLGQEQLSSTAQSRRKLLARECPVCYSPIIGIGFPVLPLREIASLIQNGDTDNKSEANQNKNEEDTYATALRLAYYAQSQLAEHSASEMIKVITSDQWRTGVYIWFQAVVNRIFFETYALTLHGKVGGLKVLLNAAQRMLAVQLMPVSKNSAEAKKTKKDPHTLVKVAPDGKFNMTTDTYQITKLIAETAASAPRNAAASFDDSKLKASTALISAAQISLMPMGIETKNADIVGTISLLRNGTNAPAIIPARQQVSSAWTVDTVASIAHLTTPEVRIAIANLTAQNNALERKIEKIKTSLSCHICKEPALLPKVLASCGHIACETCLNQLDDLAFKTLIGSGAGASAMQHLLERRCPLCRHEIIGAGFPVLALKEIAATLCKYGYIQGNSADPQAPFFLPKYQKETAEIKHIVALQIGCYAQSQLAQYSVSEVIKVITPDQWKTGVNITFESAVSTVFFDFYAMTLHGKAGGVNVIKKPQRMLDVRLLVSKNAAEAAKTKEPHLLVKVAFDGQFNITTATPTNATTPSSLIATGGSAESLALLASASAAGSTHNPVASVSATQIQILPLPTQVVLHQVAPQLQPFNLQAEAELATNSLGGSGSRGCKS